MHDEFKQMLKIIENELIQEREENPDKETCIGCTFEEYYHPIYCECYRYPKYKKYKNEFRNEFSDNWINIKKHHPSNYFDSRW
jgi:hypothetical protein